VISEVDRASVVVIVVVVIVAVVIVAVAVDDFVSWSISELNFSI
jgi:hypothetical protein